MVDIPRTGWVQPVEGIPGGTPIPFTPGFNPSSFVTAQKTVASPGTAENLPSIVIADGITAVIKAKDTNTGKIYISNSQANAEDPTVAFELNPSQAVIVNVTNTNLAWIDAVVADEGVDIMTVATYSGGGGSGGGSSSPNQPTFAVGQVDVASPGTAERLPAKAVPSGFSVVVRAKPGNTGSIWVGPDAATAEDHDVAYELQSGDFVEYFVTNVNEIFIDADVDDEGVCWTVEAA